MRRVEVNTGNMLEILPNSKTGIIIQLSDQEKLHKRNLKRDFKIFKAATERRKGFKREIQDRGKHLKRNRAGEYGGTLRKHDEFQDR